MEIELPKDGSRLNNYRKWTNEWSPYIDKKSEEGVLKRTCFTDNTGHLMSLMEFEDMETLAKLWNDEKYHRLMRKGNIVMNNLKIRLCRPMVRIPPKE